MRGRGPARGARELAAWPSRPPHVLLPAGSCPRESQAPLGMCGVSVPAAAAAPAPCSPPARPGSRGPSRRLKARRRLCFLGPPATSGVAAPAPVGPHAAQPARPLATPARSRRRGPPPPRFHFPFPCQADSFHFLSHLKWQWPFSATPTGAPHPRKEGEDG